MLASLSLDSSTFLFFQKKARPVALTPIFSMSQNFRFREGGEGQSCVLEVVEVLAHVGEGGHSIVVALGTAIILGDAGNIWMRSAELEMSAPPSSWCEQWVFAV